MVYDVFGLIFYLGLLIKYNNYLKNKNKLLLNCDISYKYECFFIYI